jgi:eukaryotic-like serine/threonine-protein kinase
MFMEEARLGAQLRHPAIVDVFDVGEDGGLRFIAMEYIEGRTLSELVTRGLEVGRPLPRPHAAHIIAEVAQGLGYLQGGLPGRGRPPEVVHRDISPPNLIVSYAGVTKIIDFGIARRSDMHVDEAGLKPGKVSYMSPEQVRGHHLDGRSDIFSLGTVLYEITLGRRLFRGPAHTVMRRIVEEEPPPPSYIDRQYPSMLERVVMRALAKRPEDRYASGGEMALELERYLNQVGEPVRERQIASYISGLYDPEVVNSAPGVEAAREFAEDEAEGMPFGGEMALDLDRRPGAEAGAELAHALRDTHPIDLAMNVDSAAQQSAPFADQMRGPAPARSMTPPLSEPAITPELPTRASFVTVMIVALVLGLVAGGLSWLWMMRGP